MKVFMLGWEFPPHISGGLGTACQGLTQGLDQVGVEIMFVLPMSVPEGTQSHVTFRTPSHLAASRLKTIETETATRKSFTLHVLPAILQPYATPEQFEELVRQYRQKHKHTIEELIPTPGQSIASGPGGYGGDMMTQVQRYARLAVGLFRPQRFGQFVDQFRVHRGLPLAQSAERPNFDLLGQVVDDAAVGLQPP